MYDPGWTYAFSGHLVQNIARHPVSGLQQVSPSFLTCECSSCTRSLVSISSCSASFRDRSVCSTTARSSSSSACSRLLRRSTMAMFSFRSSLARTASSSWIWVSCASGELAWERELGSTHQKAVSWTGCCSEPAVVATMSSYKWFNVASFDGHAITFYPNRILRQISHHNFHFRE